MEPTDAGSNLLALADCAVDLRAGSVRLGTGEVRRLTPAEGRLLACLAERPGADVDRDELARRMRVGSCRTVDVTVRRLRAKLGDTPNPRHILTSHGVGYRLTLVDPRPAVAAPAPRVVLALPTGVVDLGRRVFVPTGGAAVPLTALEARVLHVLGRQLGAPVGRDELARSAWGLGERGRAVDGLIGRLREKLDRPPVRVLHNVKGAGYRLEGQTLPRANLPEPGTPYVCPPELAAAAQRLGPGRWLTIVGPAGVGKTRLAIELARGWLTDHPERCARFCALAHADGPRSLESAMADALGVEGRLAGDPIGDAVRQLPAGALLILDNLEQLLPWRDLLLQWVAQCRGAVVSTSREAVGAPSEEVLGLSPLDPERSASLYEALTGEPPPEQVIERLDGLPLALELAAARAERHPGDALAARLTRPLDLLVRRRPGAVSPHATLRGAFDQSWDLLSPVERAVCAVFVDPWTATSAAAVSGVERVEPVLADLGRKSLVLRVDTGFRMLPIVRSYAGEKQVFAAPDARARHAEHFAALAGEWARSSYGGPWLVDARARGGDLIAVIRNGSPAQRGLALRALVFGAVHDHSVIRAREATHEAAARGVEPPDQPVLDGATAWLAFVGRDPTTAERALAQARRSAEPDLAARRFLDLVELIWRLDQADVEGACAIARRWVDLRSGPRAAAESIAVLCGALPDGPERDEWLDRALSAAEALGDPHVLGTVWVYQGRRSRARGDLRGVVEAAARVRALGGPPRDEAFALIEQLHAEYHFGHLRDALATFRRFSALAADTWWSDAVRPVAAACWLELGELDRAAEVLEPLPLTPASRTYAALLRAWALRFGGRPAEALAVLAAHPPIPELGWAHDACAVGAAAEARRWDEVDRRLPDLAADPERTAAARALVALLRAPGDERFVAEARGVLASQRVVRCDDGVERVRGFLASMARIGLERALGG